MLSSLEIKNFRTFSHLAIERLGRVNLIVGKNNVGKTTLLEALRIYGSISPGSTIALVLHRRNEITRTTEKKAALDLRSLFHGRKAHEDDEIRIRELTADSLEQGFLARPVAERDSGERVATIEDWPRGPLSRLSVDVLNGPLHCSLTANGESLLFSPPKIDDCDPEPPFLQGVGSQPDFEDTIAVWWDALSLTEAENRVLLALQTIAPVEGASFIGDPRENAGRFAKVKIAGMKDPSPLATLGDGAVRMFQIAVAMEYAATRAKSIVDAGAKLENAFPLLLIDEVETGVHYTLHADLWRFIFKTAELLGVQVFATSHSWDCVKGFQEALVAKEEYDGLVIRLEKVEGEEQTGAVIIDREGVPIVVRDSIEVR